MVRWKTGLGLIDLDRAADRSSPSGGRLFNNAHGGAFYSPLVGRIATMPKVHRMKTLTWNEIVTVVSAGIAPPIWNEYLLSAQRRIEMGDVSTATIDLAIAAESVVKQFPRISKRASKSKCHICSEIGRVLDFPFQHTFLGTRM